MALSATGCICKVKHYLHPDSPLGLFIESGLRKQSLLSPDSQYTLNHILIALITVLKEKALFQFDFEEDEFYILNDKGFYELYPIFGSPRKYLYLSELRYLIDIRFFNNSEKQFELNKFETFICPEQDDKIIFELLNYENFNYLHMYFTYNCQKEVMDEFPYINVGLRLKTDFDFGNYTSRPIRYMPCDCKRTLPF